MEEFCASCNLKNLIKQHTCFKNLGIPTCIDYILKNQPKSFHLSSVSEAGLSDFHKLTLMVLKVFHAEHKCKFIQCRDFNHFDNASFRTNLLQELPTQNVHPGEFEEFKYIFSKLINTHAPQ